MLTDKREINKIKLTALVDTLNLFLVVILVILDKSWFYAPLILVPIARFISKRIFKTPVHKIKPVIHPE